MKRTIVAIAISTMFVATMADAKSRSSSRRYSSSKSYSSSYKSKSYSSPKKSKSYSSTSTNNYKKPAKKSSFSLSSAAAMAAIGTGLYMMNDSGNIEYDGVEYGDLDDLCAAVSDNEELIELCDMVD